jgi:hypothetical protein
MSNQRHPDQTLIAVAMDKALRSSLALGKRKINRDQSTFVRMAIIEKLKNLDVPVDESWAFAADRSLPNSGKDTRKGETSAVADSIVRKLRKEKFGR